MSHSHPCLWCRQPVSCVGPVEANYDGFPSAVCVPYEVMHEEPICPDCDERLSMAAESEDVEDVA